MEFSLPTYFVGPGSERRVGSYGKIGPKGQESQTQHEFGAFISGVYSDFNARKYGNVLRKRDQNEYSSRIVVTQIVAKGTVLVEEHLKPVVGPSGLTHTSI